MFSSKDSLKKLLKLIKRKYERFSAKDLIIVISCRKLDKLDKPYIRAQLLEVYTQITLLTYDERVKNAADNLLIDAMVKFVNNSEYKPAETFIILMTGDGDFCEVLEDFKKKGHPICLIHPESSTNPALLKHAHTSMRFYQFRELSQQLE